MRDRILVKLTVHSTVTICSTLRGFAQWLLTRRPSGVLVGMLPSGRAFGRLEYLTVPDKTKADALRSIEFSVCEYPEKPELCT